MSGLCTGWANASLEDIALVNPRLDKDEIDPDLEVSFVPMPAVEAESGKVDVSGKRRFSEVVKGYTAFKEQDVLFAKITPCMENGKMAVVPEVHGGIGFGSTEFHVLRPAEGIAPKYLYFFVSSKSFRMNAEHNMTGAVGQRRVPTTYLSQALIPLPPSAEQHRIVSKIEELFSELDAGVENLKKARAQLAVYRQALLKHAFEGRLTAEWREKHADELESAEQLLARIRTERRNMWKDAQLKKIADSNRLPPPQWENKYREPDTLNTTTLTPLPKLWAWASVEQLSIVSSGQTPSGMPTSSELNGTLSWFRVGDMNSEDNQKWMTRGGVLLHEQTFKRLGLKLLPAGSIIFPKRGGAIATNKKRRLRFDAACDLNVMAVSPAPLIAEFLWLFFQALDLAKLSDGSNVPQINNPDIAPRPVALPPLEEQFVIVGMVENQIAVVESLEAEIDLNLQKAEALRQSILKKAFAGELVPQDPADEPAAELLARLRAEREAGAGVAKPGKPRKIKTA